VARSVLVPDRDAAPVVVRSGRSTIVAADPVEIVEARGLAAFAALDRLTPGWWAGFLSYDLGRAVERVVPRLDDERGLPDLLLARFDARLVLDDGPARFEGGRAAVARLQHRLETASEPTPVAPVGPPRSSLDRSAFQAGVRAVVSLITAGDCYQVNLTRRLTWESAVDPSALHRALAERNPAPHSALVVLPRSAGTPVGVVSASPECFLAWRGREVETRPIKGTARDADSLRASAKDRAENVMIVDLARNDLGRVCEFGSISVPELCAVEAHPGLHHLVSTVRGRRRAGSGLAPLLRATFPPASVTGAPKPRVLQAIEDLEPVRRGVYCGAVGWIDTELDEGDLAVAIRTFTIADGRTHLGVGGGIVADSDPGAEWLETELKAARLLEAAGAPASERPRDGNPVPHRASAT
jgi:para-aminobenzoate synthetase component I